jgi:hypothetical protein
VRFFFFFSFSFTIQFLQNLIYTAEIGTATTTMTTDNGKPFEGFAFAATTFKSPPEDKHPLRVDDHTHTHEQHVPKRVQQPHHLNDDGWGSTEGVDR